MISDEQVLSLSTQEYSKYMKGAKVSTNKAKTEMVKRVGQRLATAVETYLRQNGLAQELQYYKWEFNLVQDNAVNAFCMPGGKIVVYEGLLPVTKDEASLAIVLGHEIAHAVAKHSAEQMSEQAPRSICSTRDQHCRFHIGHGQQHPEHCTGGPIAWLLICSAEILAET